MYITFLIGRKLKTSQYDWPTVEEEDGDEQAQGEMDMFRYIAEETVCGSHVCRRPGPPVAYL